MFALGLDTSAGIPGLAIVSDQAFEGSKEGELFTISVEGNAPAAESILPLLETLVSATGLSILDEAAALGVCVGPGGFTATRVGIATALGLRFQRGTATFPCGSLSAVQRARSFGGRSPSAVHAFAGRGEAYVQRFSEGMGWDGPEAFESKVEGEYALSAIELVPLDSLSGDALVWHGNPPKRGIAPERLECVSHGALGAALLAFVSARRGETGWALAPLYVRPPDAKLPGGKSLSS